ncbi:MAG: family 1 glycosylhydrolase [Candidatus Nealsonbacteria bacterium]
MKKNATFPQGFLWGSATSSHQVEGGTLNDWTLWEMMGRAKNLSGKACDHWNLQQFKEDVERMQVLGLNAYRMSIEWSRIMPKPWVINQAVLDQYRQMLVILRQAGISTMVTLHHFTNPIWFVEQGDWIKAPLEPFYSYVDAATRALADYVDYWNTFNESLVMVYMGYLTGQWPPGKKGRIIAAAHLRKRFAEVHNEVYRIVKRNTGRPVGLVHNFTSYETAHNRWIERTIAGLQDRIFNRWIVEHTKNDFIGVNFYFHQVFDGFRPAPAARPGNKVSDFGWEIIPQSLTRVLLGLKKYNLPIYVTESGVADAKDTLRADFIKDHVQALRLARRAGVDVRGYFYWSLLDNFEWAEGFTKRFGLIEVNFETQERRIRPSAYAYRDIIKATNS